MLTQMQNIGAHEQILAHVEKLSINKNSLKNVIRIDDNYEGLNSTVETDIHYLSETQAKLLFIAYKHLDEATFIMNKCSMLHPYEPVGDDKIRYDSYVESARIAFRAMWKNIKDELTPKLPWIKGKFKELNLRKGNIIAVKHRNIPKEVTENEPLSLIAQKPAYLN